MKDEARLFQVAAVGRKTLLQQLLGGFGFEGALAPLGALGRALSGVLGC
jgi:hypothetical protein